MKTIDMGTLQHLVTHHLVGTPYYVRMYIERVTEDRRNDKVMLRFYTRPDGSEIELGGLGLPLLWSRERLEWEINKLPDLLHDWELALSRLKGMNE